MNPILPLQECIPDVEARVFGDGKIYLYGSKDILGHEEYCSREYYTFYSDDFINWKKSHLLMDTTTEEFVRVFGTGMLYAPDCIEKDGKYYLFFCIEDGNEGVAVSDTATGPFVEPRMIKGVEKDGIDPSAFVDDDGAVYYFWGQFHLRGARMAEDVSSIERDSKQEEILTEKEHGFHEGASIRKRNGIYYMLYTDISSGRATQISYATSEKPLGPYEKRGVIIDNVNCDPQTWNNHGSMQQIGDEWYIFYHRSSQNTKYNRRVCVEKITFDENGDIQQVKMTSSGQEEVIPAERCLEAGRCSGLGGEAYTFTEIKDDHCLFGIAGIRNENFCTFEHLDFHNQTTCHLTLRNTAGLEKVELGIGESRYEVWKNQGCFEERGNEWKEITIPVTGVSGVYQTKCVFYGSNQMQMEMRDICFR